MTNQTHSSLELSKFLMEKGFDRPCDKSYYGNAGTWHDALVDNDMYTDVDDEFRKAKLLPSYDLIWDICIRYGKELFGETNVILSWNPLDCGGNEETSMPANKHFTIIILQLLQQGKTEKAEQIIKDNSVL